MAKVRVYEIAREVGIANKELVQKVRALGIEVSNHMSSVDVEDAARIRRSLEKERQESLEERRVKSTVIRRRSKSSRRRPVEPPPEAEAAPASEPALAAEAAEAAEAPAIPEAGDAPAAVVPGPPPEAEAVPEAPTVEATAAEPTAGAEPTATEPAGGAEPEPEPAGGVEAEPVPAAEPKAEQAPAADDEVAPTPSEPSEAPAAREAETPAEEKPMVEAPSAAPADVESAEPPPAPAQPEKSGEEKLGPTGRFIDLKKASVPRVVITDLGQNPGAPRGRREYFPGRDRRGPPGRRFGGPGPRGAKGRRKQVKARGPAQKTEITIPAEHKRRIRMEDAISTGDLAKQMGIKATDVLKKLWGLGMTGITINSTLDYETAGVLASEFGFEVENVAFQEDDILKAADEDVAENQQTRPPVVTIMGHVDHGKTSLLDSIRKSDIVSGEAGGITQHIGAYKVKTKQGEVVFIDTPGHEAFSAMRARGANATDIVILVVAADDGVMPQTREAIQHSQAAEVPIIVAINKIDREQAQPERIKQDLTSFNLVPEDWGGDTIFCEVSALTKKGIDQLLEMLVFQAEMLELSANPDRLPKGVVLEAQLDKARGPVATVLVQEGTLHPGDIVVAGENYARVRALVDDRGRTIKEALPSTPVQILGLNGVPDAGEIFNGVKDEKDAKRVASHREEQRRRKEVATAGPGTSLLERLARGEQKELKVVLKADQQGTAEAVREALAKLTTEKVELAVVGAAVGAITESDINMAKAADALVVGFHVRPTKQARELAERENVEMKMYNVIYEMLDDVKDAMRGLLPKERTEKVVGRIEVRDTFTIPKIGTIAGCFVLDGKITRNSLLRIFRNNVQVYEGRVSSLRRFKDDVREVEKGYECGIGVQNYNDIKVEDLIEVYEIEEHAAEL